MVNLWQIKTPLVLFALNLICMPCAVLSAELSDPTRPGWRPSPVEATTISTTSILTAIVLRGTDKSALIGERYYRQGDLFQGKRIVLIEFDQVQLQSENGLETMKLAPRIQLNQPSSIKKQQPQANKTKATPQ